MAIFNKSTTRFQERSEAELEGASGVAGTLRNAGSSFLADYRSTFLPAAQRAIGLAEGDIEGDVGRAGVDTAADFDTARGIMNRNLSRMGVNPNSGRFAGLQQQWALARAAATAGAKTRARRSGNESRLRSLLAAAQLGSSLPGLSLRASESEGALRRNVSSDFGEIAGESAALGAFEEETPAPVTPNSAIFRSNNDFSTNRANARSAIRESQARIPGLRSDGKIRVGGLIQPGTPRTSFTGSRGTPQTGAVASGNRAIRESVGTF